MIAPAVQTQHDPDSSLFTIRGSFSSPRHKRYDRRLRTRSSSSNKPGKFGRKTGPDYSYSKSEVKKRKEARARHKRQRREEKVTSFGLQQDIGDIGPFIDESEQLPPTAVTFKYDTDKIRQANRAWAIRRWEQENPREASAAKEGRVKMKVHHINHDHSDARPQNMHYCSDKQEKNLHRQLIQITTELINAGIIRFNRVLHKYFIDDASINAKIANYRERIAKHFANLELAKQFSQSA